MYTRYMFEKPIEATIFSCTKNQFYCIDEGKNAKNNFTHWRWNIFFKVLLLPIRTQMHDFIDVNKNKLNFNSKIHEFVKKLLVIVIVMKTRLYVSMYIVHIFWLFCVITFLNLLLPLMRSAYVSNGFWSFQLMVRAKYKRFGYLRVGFGVYTRTNMDCIVVMEFWQASVLMMP